MHRVERRRQRAATDASLLLVQDALVQIRAMANLRQLIGPPATDDESPDYHEHIHLIADVCENLPGHLRASTRGTPLEGLQYVWDSANPGQRQWLRTTLDRHGIDVTRLVSTTPKP